MKAIFILCALSTCCAFAQPVIQPRITSEELVKRQQSAPVSKLQQPKEGEAQVTRPDEQSLIKQSTILHDGKNWTIVPRGAVIFLPEALKSRIETKPVGTLLSWTEFLTNNISWITTTDISFKQAAGEDPLPAERVAFWSKQDKLVVAVHQGGPISVRISPPPANVTKR